jgi:hypothetical protein
MKWRERRITLTWVLEKYTYVKKKGENGSGL